MNSYRHLTSIRYDHHRLVKTMLTEFRMGRGLRIGETTVISRRVHVIYPEEPGEVKIIINQDAGAAFYARIKKNEILHIDIFHEIAEVDHRRIAEAIKHAVYEYFRDPVFHHGRGFLFPSAGELLDLIDIQTGSGGGRVSGSLNYGRKYSLRKAHFNHVHLAAMFPDNCLAVVFYIVSAIEEELACQGIEIRKVERISHLEGKGKADLSPYSSIFDSHLNETGKQPADRDWKSLDEESRIDTVASMAEEFGGRVNMAKLLESLTCTGNIPPDIRSDVGDLDEVIERLTSWQLIGREMGKFSLTPKGEEVKSILTSYASEIEAAIRRIIRKMPIIRKFPQHEEGKFRKKARGDTPRIAKTLRPLREGEWCDSIAVPETVVASLVRRKIEKDAPSRLLREDIRVYRRRPVSPPEICLLIDASASMVGRRIRAAKYLIRHLTMACRVKISVLTFQERDVKIHIASTRSKKAIEEGVKRIQPQGLTPLAAGIADTLEFIKAKRIKDVLLILITDGIPTMNRWTADPARDALTAAKAIADRKIAFMCVGLQPNKDFLSRLVDVAHGKLYIVDEFDKDILVNLVRAGRRESTKGSNR
ncbi:MAG: VWA domain-containing protein [Bacillota bacterium]|jgi:magnesium chelatase subunit D|nr:VWA domain-containing protein [Bacillota bacterium]MDI9415335.1 VWA domain-containing protein [Bacillota bacterium]NLD12579.1 VWA domain-containing protein [Bacillota bacterium]HOB88072.1 VWA domain-containing protein [Bacillota bacterium]HOJ57082.1 VWA domain-containing protein [Bacillota bacterium]